MQRSLSWSALINASTKICPSGARGTFPRVPAPWTQVLTKSEVSVYEKSGGIKRYRRCGAAAQPDISAAVQNESVISDPCYCDGRSLPMAAASAVISAPAPTAAAETAKPKAQEVVFWKLDCKRDVKPSDALAEGAYACLHWFSLRWEVVFRAVSSICMSAVLFSTVTTAHDCDLLAYAMHVPFLGMRSTLHHHSMLCANPGD